MTALEHIDNLTTIADTKAKKLPNSMIADLRSAAEFLGISAKQIADLKLTVLACLKSVGIDFKNPDAQARLDAAGKLPSVAIQQYVDTLKAKVTELETNIPKDQREMLAALRSAQTNYSSMKSAYDVLQRENELLKKTKSGIPHNALCFFKDGDKWCVVNGDFKNLQESPAGFGATFDEALTDFAKNRTAANGAEFSDGCDHEGFEGGCVRMGHTPETCPTKP